MIRGQWILGCVLAGAVGVVQPDPASTTHHSELGLYLSNEGLSRLDPLTLAPVWTALRGLTVFEPVWAGDALLVGSSDGIYAIDPESGATRWHLTAQAPRYTPVPAGDTLYVAGADGELSAVDLTRRTVSWTRHFPPWVYPPAVVDGRLIVTGGTRALHALDRETGRTVWTTPLDQEAVYRPVVAGPHQIALTTFSGAVHLVDSRDGTVLWTVTRTVPSLSPLPVGAMLVAVTLDGELFGIRTALGTLSWIRSLGGRVTQAPALIGGHVMVWNDEGDWLDVDPVSGAGLEPVTGGPVSCPPHGGRSESVTQPGRFPGHSRGMPGAMQREGSRQGTAVAPSQQLHHCSNGALAARLAAGATEGEVYLIGPGGG